MTYHNTDNLKLEIEVDPTGLPNLVQNPSGEKGSWAYSTPVANTTMSANHGDPDFGDILTFYTGATQACYFTTEFMPAVAGRYYAARWLSAFTIHANVILKPRFEWYNSSKVLLSSSTQGTGGGTYNTTYYYPAVVAPANTAYVKLRFDMYRSGGNPTADDYAVIKNVMVTHAATTAEIGSVRSNLVPNPNFEVDTLGWTSNTATLARTTSAFSSGAASLSVTSSSTSDFVYSPMFAISGGSTYSGQIKSKAATTARTLYLYLYWYDSGGVLISNSTGVGSTNNTSTWTTLKNENKTAPSNAAYARLMVYEANGAPAGEVHYIDDVMVEAGSTAGTYFDGSSTSGGAITYAWATNKVFTNLITNPSAETNTTGWTKWTEIGASGTLSRTTTQAKVGTASLMLTGSTGGDYQGVRTAAGTSGMPVTAGTRYTLKASLRATSGITGSANYLGGNIFFYDSAGNILGGYSDENSIAFLYTNAAASTWTDVTYTQTAPAGAAYACVALGAIRNDGTDITGSADFFADAVYFGAADIAYFDGSTTDVASFRDYAWTGTTNNSTSTLTIPSISTRTETSAFAFTEPVEWRNILGPTHEISINRKGLDVGLLNATILDALLDPAVADVIRPGRKVRIQAYRSDNVYPFWEGWFSLFEGTVSSANVAYDKPKVAGSEVETRIQLNASDAISSLANQGEARGVESMEELPYLLEGKGVPWNVEGSGDQVSSASIVSYNDNASVLDQIAITRDTNQAYACVDKSGVLTTYPAGSPYYGLVNFSDDQVAIDTWGGGWRGYTGIDVSFSTEECINHVIVNWLRYDIGTSQTTEIPYGPYTDNASIAEWGARSATFTIHGAVESGSAIADFAADVLAANATPTVKVNNLQFRVFDEDTLSAAIDVDLNLLTDVYWQGSLYSPRISGVEHNITPTTWDVKLEFVTSDSVAAPTWTPSPPMQPVEENVAVLNPVGAITMFAAATAPDGWLLCEGGTFSSVDYPELAALLGDTYGVHSGTTYYLPNFNNRFPRGVTGTPGGTGGSSTIAEANLPAHNHPAGSLNVSARTAAGSAAGLARGNATTDGTAAVAGSTGNAGSGTAYWQPYLNIKFIIKADA